MYEEAYRQEHLDFHNGRVHVFMTAARALKQYGEFFSFGGEISPVMKNLISRLVYEARTENTIARYWRHMSIEQMNEQMEFWNR
jgi:hypothetical protein